MPRVDQHEQNSDDWVLDTRTLPLGTTSEDSRLSGDSWLVVPPGTTDEYGLPSVDSPTPWTGARPVTDNSPGSDTPHEHLPTNLDSVVRRGGGSRLSPREAPFNASTRPVIRRPLSFMIRGLARVPAETTVAARTTRVDSAVDLELAELDEEWDTPPESPRTVIPRTSLGLQTLEQDPPSYSESLGPGTVSGRSDTAS